MKQNSLFFSKSQLSASCLLCFFLQNTLIATVEVPPIPKPATQTNPTPQPESTALPEEKVGIQGNWMKKNQYLVESNKVFDSMQDLLTEIQSARADFNQKYHAIDDEFDNFYLHESLDQGKLQELFESLEKYIEKKRKKKLEEFSAQANAKEELYDQAQMDLLETDVKRDKENLEQLKRDLKSIDDLDKSIVERVQKVDEQITQAKELFDQAKTLINDLWYIIDDKKAREIYYEIKGAIGEKIKNIHNYLKEDLANNFDTVIATARAQIKKTQEEIKQLEASGIIIRDRSKRIEQIKLEKKQIELAQKAAEEIKLKEKTIELTRKKPSLWYEKIYENIVTIGTKTYSYLTDIYTRIIDYLSGKK